jgi:hypothetical protein
MNDPNKTLTSLTFFTFAIMGVPLWDISTTAVPEDKRETVRDLYRVSRDVLDTEENDMETDENTISEENENYLCALFTAGAEEWLGLFLQRIFAMVLILFH